MTVRVQSILLAGGGSPLTTMFSDTFHRANVANLGPNWVYLSTPTALSQIHTTAYSINGNTFQMLDSSANQTENNSPECFVPLVLMNSAVNGKTQFSQARFLGNTAAAGHDMRGGVACMVGLNASGDFQCYIFWVEFGPAYRIFKYAANTLTDIGGGNIGVPVNNDVMRLSVTANGASNTVNCLVNGVSIKTVTDNTPIITGFPGLSRSIWISGAAPPPTSITWDNYSGGIGT